jgi:pimeloyl-ACP methyl ester carboxylesterase
VSDYNQKSDYRQLYKGKEPLMIKFSKKTKIIHSVLIVLLLSLILIYPEKRSINDKVRELSGSDYIKLSEGWTEYEIGGSEHAPAVILIHGLSVSMYDWDRQYKFLINEGYRVLRYNHFGRGLSDRPGNKYERSRYVKQLNELMEALDIEDAHLIGHSMGGLITAAFATEYPEKVKSQILISPALHMAENNTGVTLVRIPLLGDLMAITALPGILTSRAEELFSRSGISELESYNAAFKKQTRYRGFANSVKSLFRNNMMDDFSDTYARLEGDRTLLIWGSEDSSVPTEHTEKIISLLPGIQTEFFEGCGHMPNMEEAKNVNALILDFLQK